MKKNIFLSLVLGAFIAASCSKEETQPAPFIPIEPETPENTLPAPGEAKSIVVAHRGGSAEAGKTSFPDNSIASLRYAMSIGCYASELDVYWTKDDQIVVAHADSECRINGMHPWQHTLEELRNGGKLSNGETLPSLEEYLEVVMEEGSCTKLWLDLKNITYPKQMSDEVIAACRRSCEIVKEMKADNFVEFICTGNSTVYSASKLIAAEYGIPIGWMANRSASDYASNANMWANLSTEYFVSPIGSGDRTIEEFADKNVAISIYNADTATQMRYFVERRSMMKAICTNYPKQLITLIQAQGN